MDKLDKNFELLDEINNNLLKMLEAINALYRVGLKDLAKELFSYYEVINNNTNQIRKNLAESVNQEFDKTLGKVGEILGSLLNKNGR